MSSFHDSLPSLPVNGAPLTIVMTCANRLLHLQDTIEHWRRVSVPRGLTRTFLIVDYGCQQNTFGWVCEQPWGDVDCLKALTNDHPFSYARSRNLGSWAARDGYLVITDADMMPQEPNVLTRGLLPLWEDKAKIILLDWRAGSLQRYAGSWPLLMRRNTFLESGGLEERFKGYGFEDAEYLKHVRETFGLHEVPIGDAIRHQQLPGEHHNESFLLQRRLQHDSNQTKWRRWKEDPRHVRNPDGWGKGPFAYYCGRNQQILIGSRDD